MPLPLPRPFTGMSHLVTMDLYHKEIQGFFDFPVDNLRCSPFLLQYIKENVSCHMLVHEMNLLCIDTYMYINYAV